MEIIIYVIALPFSIREPISYIFIKKTQYESFIKHSRGTEYLPENRHLHNRPISSPKNNNLSKNHV